jgi:hypothetical protein
MIDAAQKYLLRFSRKSSFAGEVRMRGMSIIHPSHLFCSANTSVSSASATGGVGAITLSG